MLRIYFSKLMPFFPKSKEKILLLDKGCIAERFTDLYKAVVGSHYATRAEIIGDTRDYYIHLGLLDLLIFPLLPIPLEFAANFLLTLILIYENNTQYMTFPIFNLCCVILLFLLFLLSCLAATFLHIVIDLVISPLGLIISTLLYPFLCLNNYADNYPRLWFELRELGIVKFEVSELQKLTTEEITSFNFFVILCDYASYLGHSINQGQLQPSKGITHGSNTIFLANHNMQAFSLVQVEQTINKLTQSFDYMSPEVRQFKYNLILFMGLNDGTDIIPFVNFLSTQNDENLKLLFNFLTELFVRFPIKCTNLYHRQNHVRIQKYCMSLLIDDEVFKEFYANSFLHNPNNLFNTIKDNSEDTKYLEWDINTLNELYMEANPLSLK